MKITIDSSTRKFFNEVLDEVERLDDGYYASANKAQIYATQIPNIHLKHIQSILMSVEGIKSRRMGDSWTTSFQMNKAYENAHFAKLVEKIVDGGLDSVSTQITPLSYEKISRYLKKVEKMTPMTDEDIDKVFAKFDGTKEGRHIWRSIRVSYLNGAKTDGHLSFDKREEGCSKKEKIEEFFGEMFLTSFVSVMKVSFNGEDLEISIDENTTSNIDVPHLCDKAVELFCDPKKPMRKSNLKLNDKPLSFSALRNYVMMDEENANIRFWNTLNNLVANAKECDWHSLVVRNEDGEDLKIDFSEADHWYGKNEVKLWRGWSVRGKYVGENDIDNFAKFKELFSNKLCELKKVA